MLSVFFIIFYQTSSLLIQTFYLQILSRRPKKKGTHPSYPMSLCPTSSVN